MFHVKQKEKIMPNRYFQLINQSLISETALNAQNSDRKRKNFNLHQLDDTIQRFLNAIEPESYVRPHRHMHPPKIECFIALKGSFTVVIFDDNGEILDTCVIGGKDNIGIDVKLGMWHTVFSNESGSVFFEVKEGPYNPMSDKDFAVWAPAENEAQSKDYWFKLKERVKEFNKIE